MSLWVFLFVILTLSSGCHCSPLPSLPLRVQRHTDSVFSNSYRKVLGQVSARQHLQDIMTGLQGMKNQGQGARARRSCQEDSMCTNQKPMALESSLKVLLPKQRNSQG